MRQMQALAVLGVIALFGCGDGDPVSSTSIAEPSPQSAARVRSNPVAATCELPGCLPGYEPPGTPITSEPGAPPVIVVGPSGSEHEMVFVPAGVFRMGSEEGLNQDRPAHDVFLDGFYIDRYEVTNRGFATFVLATGRRSTAEMAGRSWVTGRQGHFGPAEGARWDAPAGPGSDLAGLQEHPVVHVSWSDARAYCEWAGLRLPTEAEWEKAARGADGRSYPWGEGIDRSRANYGSSVFSFPDPDSTDGWQFTGVVGSYPAGLSPYGVHDMAGNVREWVADWFDAGYYAVSPSREPPGPSTGAFRVVRGGSWVSIPDSLRSWNRSFGFEPTYSGDGLGFRCARDQNGG